MTNVNVDSYDAIISARVDSPMMILQGISFEQAIEIINCTSSMTGEHRFLVVSLLKLAKKCKGGFKSLYVDSAKNEMLISINFHTKKLMEDFINTLEKEAL